MRLNPVVAPWPALVLTTPIVKGDTNSVKKLYFYHFQFSVFILMVIQNSIQFNSEWFYSKNYWHYVFCPIVFCPNDFFPTALTPTITTSPTTASIPTYSYPNHSIVNPCHFPLPIYYYALVRVSVGWGTLHLYELVGECV